jgi:hypothetical protein
MDMGMMMKFLLARQQDSVAFALLMSLMVVLACWW